MQNKVWVLLYIKEEVTAWCFLVLLSRSGEVFVFLWHFLKYLFFLKKIKIFYFFILN
jgi:hypothetical protein